ncbi:TetR family transcriptional regulator [Corynebacterium sp. NPDC060344]|uniref:TetR family transcriptional regulator n=1 Tax=Corynebacterium sp. NPDC060344 TaxID=3347101 RepID=UPI00365A3328
MAQSGNPSRPRLTADERREQALAAARRLILRAGIEAASVRNVATEAGMATGSLRHIFPSHESLFTALMADNADRAAARIQDVFTRELAAGTPVRGTFLAVLRETIPLSDASRADFVVQLALFTGHPDSAPIREAIADAGEKLDQLCAITVAKLRPDLAPDLDPDLVSDVATTAELATDLRVALDGIALRCLENPGYATDAGTRGAEATLARALDRVAGA